MTKDELIKLAQGGMRVHSPNDPEYIVCEALIKALAEDALQRLSDIHQEMEQQPVAYIGMIDEDHFADVCHKANGNSNTPLYAAPPAQQEPVAWTTGLYGGYCVIRAANPAAILPLNIALYTSPPQRKPLRTVTYVCPVCAASLERKE